MLRPQIVDGGHGIVIAIVAREVHADGLLGVILQVPWLGPQLLDPLIKTAILNQINGQLGGTLRQGLPNSLTPLSPSIVSAKFVDLGGGKLGIDLVMTAHIAQASVNNMIAQALVRK